MTGDGDPTKASHVPLFSNSIVKVTFGAPNIVGRGSGKPETVRALHQLHSETWQVEKVNMEKNAISGHTIPVSFLPCRSMASQVPSSKRLLKFLLYCTIQHNIICYE